MDGFVATENGKLASSSKLWQLTRSWYYPKLLTFAQLAADFLTVVLAYFISYIVYTRGFGKPSPQSLETLLLISLGAAVVYLVILDKEGLYKREVSLMNIKELRGIFHVGIYAAAIILSASFYVRSVSLSRITITIALAVTPLFLYLQRQAFYFLHLYCHQRGWGKRKAVIYGAGDVGLRLAKRLFESPSLGYLPIGFLDDEGVKRQAIIWQGICPKGGLPVLGDETAIARIKSQGVETVFISLPSATDERNQRLVDRCIEFELDFAVVPNLYHSLMQNIESFEIGGIPMLRTRTHKASLFYLAIKRVVDFTLSAFFITMLSPLLIFFAVAIKLDSRGPIIFKQKRVGLNGREFSFYKFRSMYVEAPKYARTPTDSADARITPVGRWLRRTSLDELPQLFNVLRGDMSLVGPRPEMPFIVAEYTSLQRKRLDAKPGITGVWQISACRGEPIHQNMEYDLFYLENRSLLLDFAVIVKTILSVVRGVGAV